MKKRRINRNDYININLKDDVESSDTIESSDNHENCFFSKKLNLIDINKIVMFEEVYVYNSSSQIKTNVLWQDAKNALESLKYRELSNKKIKELVNLKDQYGKILPFYQLNRNIESDLLKLYINNTNMNDLMNDFIDNIIISKLDNQLISFLCFNKDNDKYHCINLGLEFIEIKKNGLNNFEKLYDYSTFENQDRFNYNFLCKLCCIKKVNHYNFKKFIFDKILSETNDFTVLIFCCLNSDCNIDFLKYILPYIEGKYDLEKIIGYENYFKSNTKTLYNNNSDFILNNLENDNFRKKFLLNNLKILGYLNKKIISKIKFKITDNHIYRKYVNTLCNEDKGFYNKTLFNYTNFYDLNIGENDINFIFINKNYSIRENCNNWKEEIEFIIKNSKFKSFFINFVKNNLNRIEYDEYYAKYFFQNKLYSICDFTIDNYILLFENYYNLLLSQNSSSYSNILGLKLDKLSEFLNVIETDNFHENLKKKKLSIKSFFDIFKKYIDTLLMDLCTFENYYFIKIFDFNSRFSKVLSKFSKKLNFKKADKLNVKHHNFIRIYYLENLNDICDKINIKDDYELHELTRNSNQLYTRIEYAEYKNFMNFHTRKISKIIKHNIDPYDYRCLNSSILLLFYKIRILVSLEEFKNIVLHFKKSKSYLIKFLERREIDLEQFCNVGIKEKNLLSNKLKLDNIFSILDFIVPNHDDLKKIINNKILTRSQSLNQIYQKPIYYKSNDLFDRFIDF